MSRGNENMLTFLDGEFLFSKIKEFAPDIVCLFEQDRIFSPSDPGLSQNEIKDSLRLFTKRRYVVVQRGESYPPILDRLVAVGIAEVTYGGHDQTFSLTPRGQIFIEKRGRDATE